MDLKLFKSTFFLRLLAIKVFGTLFGTFVYSRFTSLGDSGRYLSAEAEFSVNTLTERTSFADLIFGRLASAFSDIGASMLTSVLLGYIIYYLFFRSYKYVPKATFWVCLLLPHFIVWSSSAGKEVIALIGFMLVVKSCVDLAIYSTHSLKQTLVGVALGLVMRPHYFIAYSYLFVLTYIAARKKTTKFLKLSNGVLLSLLILFLIPSVVILALSYGYWVTFLSDIMSTSQSYFLPFQGAGANRLDISWGEPWDFFANFWWGMPASIIGPTILESLRRPLFIPVFFEGVLSFYLIFHLLFQLLRSSKEESKYRYIIILGFIPALILALIVHYPFGLFNPGSAVRYKQSLAPLFYFYPLLLIAESRRAVFQANFFIGYKVNQQNALKKRTRFY
jgi:hypothetical protein